MNIAIKLLHPLATPPRYASPGDAGADLCACIDEPITLYPGERRLIPTGLAVAVPEGFYARVAPRSGLAVKFGIDVLAGVIDAGYRGEIGVVLVNTTSPFEHRGETWEKRTLHYVKKPAFTINPGDRISQLIISPIERAEWVVTDELPDSVRGDGGFGSTGV